MTTPQIAPILVAVDASPESLAALDWAVEHVRMVGARLRIITAYQPGNAPSNDSARSYVDELEKAEREATRRVGTALLAANGLEDVDYEHIVALGPIGRVLSDYSHHASLAVVGTRTPTTWFQRLFQRSVTNQLTGTLACPVVSVAGRHSESQLANPMQHSIPA